MKYLIIPLFFMFSCSSVKHEELKIVKSTETFTSTQKYQIFCWVIKKHEGYRQNSYRCQAGKKTNGWGFTNVKSVKDIHHADEIFKSIVNPLFDEVTRNYPELDYLQRAVITSLYYNTGSLKNIKESSFSKSLKNNDIRNAVKSFKSWSKIRVRKGKFIVSKGLLKRRSYESKLLDGSFNMADYNQLKNEVQNIYKQYGRN